MIKVTDKAKEKLISIMDEDNTPLIRFGLKGGGCSGMSYYLVGEELKDDDDIEYHLDETHILLIDSISKMYLEDAEIDYKKDIMGESFVFKNPLSTGSCGCGSSVSFN